MCGPPGSVSRWPVGDIRPNGDLGSSIVVTFCITVFHYLAIVYIRHASDVRNRTFSTTNRVLLVGPAPMSQNGPSELPKPLYCSDEELELSSSRRKVACMTLGARICHLSEEDSSAFPAKFELFFKGKLSSLYSSYIFCLVAKISVRFIVYFCFKSSTRVKKKRKTIESM